MSYEKTLWAWFNKRAMQHMVIAKRNGGNKPWLIVIGRQEQQGYRVRKFSSLGDLIAGLNDSELDSLLEYHDIPAMELIAMAVDDGTA